MIDGRVKLDHVAAGNDFIKHCPWRGSFGVAHAFAFLLLNIVGALVFLGGEAGLAQLARNGVQSITSFSLTPIPFFVLMGEVLFHTGVALKA